MSKKMVIYWYTTNKNFSEIEAGKTYCIGEANPEAKQYAECKDDPVAIAEKRVKQELGKTKSGAHIRYSVDTSPIFACFVEFPNDDGKNDHFDQRYVHSILKAQKCEQIAKEWFNIGNPTDTDYETADKRMRDIVNYIVKDEPLGIEYKLYDRQCEAVNRFKSAYDNGETKFGLFAMPRFGKTICSFEMMNYLFEKNPDKKYIFFISAKLDAKQALREDYFKFMKSCKFKLLFNDSLNRPSQEELINNKWCFFASKQWFEGKKEQEIKNRFPIIHENDCAAVFFDEAHFARMTKKAQKILHSLNPNMIIDITGTPFRLKSNGDYNDDNSYVYSVIDENEDYAKTKPAEQPKFRLNHPEMVYITPENKFFNTNSTFSEFFDSDECSTQIQEWIKHTFCDDKFCIDNKEWDIKNVIIALPFRREYCNKFELAADEIIKKEHLPIVLTKTTTTETDDPQYIKDNEERFDKWNQECKSEPNKFHVLLTLTKGLQSVSFPDCHAVIMFNDMKSPEQYVQAAFRSKTPNDHKKEAYVIDYCKGRMLQVIDTMIKNHLEVLACNSNFKAEYERALSTIKICDGNLIRQDYTFEEIFQTFVQNWRLDKITEEIDFDVDKLINRFGEEISKIDINKFKSSNQLSLTLTERGDDYEDDPTETTSEDGDKPTTSVLTANWLEKHIENLKQQLIENGYVPFGGDETNRIKDINPDKIQVRELEIGTEKEKRKVWSYMGGDGDNDDIYIDESGMSPSTVRWKYRINNKFVNVTGQLSHGDGDKIKEKALAMVNAIIRYLPAYFFVTDKINSFEELRDRFGHRQIAETKEHNDNRQFFYKFMGCDYRYLLEVLKACDIASREQILSLVNKQIDECYDSNKNIIPEKVFNLSFSYAKNGSHPVPQELAQKMRNGKNYDLVVCGGYWITDDTTQMYITDSFSEAEIMKKLRPNCRVIYSTDILQTIEKEKEKIMKFKSFIMNPPYGNLHLPILKRMIELVVENGGTGVSLQPSDWTRLNEFNCGVWDKIGKNICSITTLDEKIKNKAFDGTTIRSNLSIFVLDPRGGCELSFSDVELSLIKKLRAKTSLRSVYPKTKGNYNLPLCGDCGHAKGWHMTICDMLSGNPSARLRFETEMERDNFRNSLDLDPYKYIVTIDGGAIPAHLPWLEDYTQPWTDERFYQYFGITPDEQKIIEKTVANAKK